MKTTKVRTVEAGRDDRNEHPGDGEQVGEGIGSIGGTLAGAALGAPAGPIGMILGGLAGAFGGWVDSLLMRMTDLFLALPGALVAIAVVAAIGPSLRNTLVAVSIVWWPYYARIVRGEVRAIATRPHVEAARLSGVGRWRLIRRHILPGAIPAAIVAASLDVGNVILLLAALSFLGLGQPAPEPELGADTARNLSLLLVDWWVPVIPGLAVLFLSLVANLGGDGLRHLLANRQ